MRLATAMLLIVLSTPAFAANPKSQGDNKDDNRVICRREVPIGSLIASRKVCLTKSQWEERSTRGNEEARKQMEDNAARNPTPSG
ncbi:hypothetical protein GON01_11125 [Sphingomonas sp. MAH-20]|uniref:Uncharacterized protein n=1 Tax=Sphingomonas horti TaxID=2682842 RepID=A0A6I4J1G5_9SPHN|nr:MULTISPECIES: hypothetical protein [Sphingomonas]MBA2919602.1 hypothetical protein [Sphingomonas sp. CGMCC 1.13658]MVO78482.1 hypothetical protein [Sphingomonas horti]